MTLQGDPVNGYVGTYAMILPLTGCVGSCGFTSLNASAAAAAGITANTPSGGGGQIGPGGGGGPRGPGGGIGATSLPPAQPPPPAPPPPPSPPQYSKPSAGAPRAVRTGPSSSSKIVVAAFAAAVVISVAPLDG